jgi:DNA polymerase
VTPAGSLLDLARQAGLYLQYMQELGLAGLEVTLPRPPQPPPREAHLARDLDDLAAFIENCRACPRGGVRAFPGQGPLAPPLMIVLDPPDETAVREGIFPGGPAGELLDRIITQALKLDRSQIYLTAALKCPPVLPGEPDGPAREFCRPVLIREMELVRPRTVLAMGQTAGQILTGRRQETFFLRAAAFALKIPGSPPLRVTFGLDMMLAEPEIKKDVWQDLRKIMRLAGLDQA